MIILCVLLVILTLISIIGGSIRFNDDAIKPIIIEPEPKEKFEDKSFTSKIDGSDQEKLKSVLSSRKNKMPAYIDSEAVKEEQHMRKKLGNTAEGFQGYEYAVFS